MENEILVKILNKLETLEARQHEIRILVENDIPKQIRLIAEQYGDIAAKLDAITDYPETRGRVSTLEHVVKSHTQDIIELQEKAVV